MARTRHLVDADQTGNVLEAHSAVASLRERTATIALVVDADTIAAAITEVIHLVA